MQKPPSQAPFSSVYDHNSEENQCQVDADKTKIEESHKSTAGRIVGRFVFKLDYDGKDIDDVTAQQRVSDVWKSLPVTDALADFLALGSRLPGEVRITSARLKIRNLRPIKLNRAPIGDGPDFTVAVAKEGEELPVSVQPMTPWLQHQDSPFRDVKSTDIEPNLNSCAQKDKSLLDSLKKRPLAQPLMTNGPFVPHCPIKFFPHRVYSIDASSDEEDQSD